MSSPGTRARRRDAPWPHSPARAAPLRDLAAGFCEAAIAGQLGSMAGPSQGAAGGPAAPWGCPAQRPLPSGQSLRVLVVRGLGESG